MKKAVLVIVSCLAEQAEGIAKTLIEEKLAACVTAIPNVTSSYTWKDKFQKCEETQLLIKTRVSNWKELAKWILALHTYEVPEFIRLDITKAHRPYIGLARGTLLK